jgi:CheY-like chemotaxis protein
VSEASAASGTSSKCVLVVEDEEAIRNNICDILEFGGYRVELASSGMQGLAKVSTTHPDAIVLDLMMPVMDGWAFPAGVPYQPAVPVHTDHADVC